MTVIVYLLIGTELVLALWITRQEVLNDVLPLFASGRRKLELSGMEHRPGMKVGDVVLVEGWTPVLGMYVWLPAWRELAQRWSPKTNGDDTRQVKRPPSSTMNSL